MPTSRSASCPGSATATGTAGVRACVVVDGGGAASGVAAGTGTAGEIALGGIALGGIISAGAGATARRWPLVGVPAVLLAPPPALAVVGFSAAAL